MRILVVEDDLTIRDALTIGLQRHDFTVETAADGPSGLGAYFAARPDLVVLDLMLPGISGIDVCRTIRAADVTPIVMLTARSDAEDVVAGLQAGADDYVVKPFELRVLVARLQAVLRRAARDPTGERIAVGELEIDVAAGEVRGPQGPIPLTPTEYRLLLDLTRNAGIARSRDDLLNSVWGYSWSGDTRLVDVHIQRLRRKVGAELVQTVRGVGYRLRRR